MKWWLQSNMGLRLVWQHWNGLTFTLQMIHSKSDWPMWSPSYSTNGPPYDWVHAVVGRASSPCLSACGGRTDAHVDCPPSNWVRVVAGPRPPKGWVLVGAGQALWNHQHHPFQYHRANFFPLGFYHYDLVDRIAVKQQNGHSDGEVGKRTSCSFSLWHRAVQQF